MAYKPEEAVMLIVHTSGGALLHSVLADTIRAISTPSELDYIKANLTQRKIPWDETTAANDNVSGFGLRTDVLRDNVQKLVDKLGA